MKLTKLKLRKMIREEIQSLNEKPKVDRKELVDKQDDVARSFKAKHTADLIKRGTPDYIQDFVDAIDDNKQNWRKIDKLTNSLRSVKQGTSKDLKIRQAIFKLVTLK